MGAVGGGIEDVHVWMGYSVDHPEGHAGQFAKPVMILNVFCRQHPPNFQQSQLCTADSRVLPVARKKHFFIQKLFSVSHPDDIHISSLLCLSFFSFSFFLSPSSLWRANFTWIPSRALALCAHSARCKTLRYQDYAFNKNKSTSSKVKTGWRQGWLALRSLLVC